MVIHALAQRGLYLGDIAKQLGVHPRTVPGQDWQTGELRPAQIVVAVGGLHLHGGNLDATAAGLDRLACPGVCLLGRRHQGVAL